MLLIALRKLSGTAMIAWAVALGLAVSCAASKAQAQVRLDIQGNVSGKTEDALKAVRDQAREASLIRRTPDQQAASAVQEMDSVLRASGYFAADISTEVRPDKPEDIYIVIVPGQRFRLIRPVAELDWSATSMALDDPDIPSRAEMQAALDDALAQYDDLAFTSARVLDAEAQASTLLRRKGFADAAALERDVVADHATGQVAVTLRLQPGAPVRLAPPTAAGSARTDEGYIAAIRPWRDGAVFRPERLAEFADALRATGAYSSVSVALADGPESVSDETGMRPVRVDLVDGPRLSYGVGVSYSNVDGTGVDGEVTWRNLLGRADTLTLGARAATLEQTGRLSWRLPNWRKLNCDLTFLAEGGQLTTDAFDQQFLEAGGAISTPILRREAVLTYGLSARASRTVETGQNDADWFYEAVGLASIVTDQSDDPLNPSRGWRLQADLQPIAVFGAETLPLVRSSLVGSAYLPLNGRQLVLAGRAKFGVVMGGSAGDIPPTRRFYSGGGGSVRGYAYQSIGPRNDNNDPLGGRSVAELAAELRAQISKTWGAVAFVDGGALGRDETPRFSAFRVGAGAGVRYDLGFAPLRLDVATPVNPQPGDSRLLIYISIGQAF